MPDMSPKDALDLSRRGLLGGAAAVTAAPAGAQTRAAPAAASAATFPTGATNLSHVSFTVNGERRQLDIDTRTTLLDALREHLHLTGSKKG